MIVSLRSLCIYICLVLCLLLALRMGLETTPELFFTLSPGSHTIIVLDPGHGGMDPGSLYGDLLEKDINLDIAFFLEDILKEKEYRVIMTRKDDTLYDGQRQKDLQHRIQVIETSNACCFISIHVNTYPSPQPSGGEVYYYPQSQAGEELAKCIQEQLQSMENGSKRSIKPGTFFLLKKTSIPGVIVEVGFLSNPQDRQNLQDPAYQKKIAQAIAQGVENYLIKKKE